MTRYRVAFWQRGDEKPAHEIDLETVSVRQARKLAASRCVLYNRTHWYGERFDRFAIADYDRRKGVWHVVARGTIECP